MIGMNYTTMGILNIDESDKHICFVLKILK
jgi:hypothetical protein